MKNAAADHNDTLNAQDELEIAKKAVLEAYANFLEAKKHLKIAAFAAGVDIKESANEHLEEALIKVKERKDEIRDNTSDYIKDNPITTVSIAFIGGILFSRLFGK
jgi:ElaB/YqjD/DUF883 family membrane-anchored ribosome-binding protein